MQREVARDRAQAERAAAIHEECAEREVGVRETGRGDVDGVPERSSQAGAEEDKEVSVGCSDLVPFKKKLLPHSTSVLVGVISLAAVSGDLHPHLE